MRTVVLGDAMLDQYIFGQATRISQEAPVMVVQENSTSQVPGGAANVAMNLQALGASSQFVGVVGDDLQATQLANALEDRGIRADGLVVDPTRPTTLKTRVVANHAHQVLRVDRESREPISNSTRNKVLKQLETALDKADLLLLSDYAKGCITEDLARDAISLAGEKGVIVVSNPKPSTAHWYCGASLLSLNQFEAAATLNINLVSKETGLEVAEQLRKELKTKGMVVTLRENGMAGAWEGESALIPAIRVEVYDEAGAGDTAISTLALSIAAGSDGKTAMELAVRTAACVVSKVGVAVVTYEELQRIAAERVS